MHFVSINSDQKRISTDPHWISNDAIWISNDPKWFITDPYCIITDLYWISTDLILIPPWPWFTVEISFDINIVLVIPLVNLFFLVIFH